MRRRSLPRSSLLALIFAAAAFVAPAHAVAPPDQYGEFVAQSFTIKDEQTRLEWERTVRGPLQYNDVSGAKAFCEGISMRLPTLKELLTLVDETPHQEYEVNQVVSQWIDENAFPKTPTTTAYWTASPKGNDYWTVDFRDGIPKSASPGDSRFVRCVRSY